ncbi:hypothetical protein LZ24_00369 [Desulfobotulus alkaliphilus]|uniref:DUF4124 domain-containing protein n=1 Tax=Desulfobotulus alkaliphilus TaxID=622671 RepID=A0A562S6D8_9BACT|nr:hypothetical protein [Desulfobotulus alkaliphilus]TWI76748.1 hypothetical protein LZ24_00369 [Desulfobotulus alkaliphilus]
MIKYTGRLSVIVCLLGLLSGTGAIASDENRYTWHDGNRQRVTYLDPAIVAVFGENYEHSSARTALASDSSDVVATYRGVQILRVREDSSVKRQVQSADTGRKLSPVFRDGGEGGPVRALPGGVIIRLKPQIEAEDWFATEGLTLVRTIPVGDNTYLVASGPGLAALNLANEMHGHKDVVWAQPNWWRPRARR